MKLDCTFVENNNLDMLKIKEIAKEKNIPLSDIASKLGISAGALSQNIAGRVGLDRLEDIAKILNVPIKELFADDGIQGFIKYKNELKEINSIEDIEKLLKKIKGTDSHISQDHENIRGAEYYK